ncbi:GspH/FimT family pseudopilin [Methylocystis sp. IM3]|uniref:GspH/FimT family pseudopilin n=1 Tax=unclassified Methylocystis TaxID=2625913 RepID=UPI000FAAB58C|nr:MAG: type II secretion system protein GspH [Hyphomicrobiales bacterium]
MMRRGGKGQGRRAGFTLLESLVVMAVIALVAGMASQLLRPPSGRLRLETAARKFCSTLRAARARAIALNSEASVFVDLSSKTYTSPVGAPGNFPADALITLEVANTQQASPRSGMIAFFPDGGSTGAVMTLQTSDARARIAVNWLTGDAKCAIL